MKKFVFILGFIWLLIAFFSLKTSVELSKITTLDGDGIGLLFINDMIPASKIPIYETNFRQFALVFFIIALITWFIPIVSKFIRNRKVNL